MNQIPVALSNAFLSISTNKNIIMLLLIALLLIVGLFMETSAACIILAPILVPVMTKLGVNPVQFGIVMCMDLALGMATPPVGVTLYVAGRIAGTSMEKITKAIFPYLIASIIAILLVAYVPSISLVIPEMFL
jgi:C4-dicarboxylate transporter DctM subunit